jgi:hypothetical protein
MGMNDDDGDDCAVAVVVVVLDGGGGAFGLFGNKAATLPSDKSIMALLVSLSKNKDDA